MLSQMDVNFDLVYQRLLNSYRGFINGWFEEANEKIVVDKNRAWLGSLDLFNQLNPDFKIIVCVRDLTQTHASVEKRHKKTVLIDFADNMANLTPYERSTTLFSENGVIGKPLRMIGQLQDVSIELQKHLYYIVFEDLLSNPKRVIDDMFEWIGTSKHYIDFNNLNVKPHESDSYYRFKYLHKTRKDVSPAQFHGVPKRIKNDIENEISWFYKIFYPGKLEK
jgi:sulfotransferase